MRHGRYLLVEFINREPSQPAILEFNLFWRRDDLRAYSLSHFRGRTIRGTLPSPVKVNPLDREEGYVVFDAQYQLPFEFGEGDMNAVSVRERFSVFLRITDKITGATIERPIPERRR